MDNPFQHSAVAATIYSVLEDAPKLRAGQEVLGELACTIADVLAKKHHVKLGKAADRLDFDDPRFINRGLWRSLRAARGRD